MLRKPTIWRRATVSGVPAIVVAAEVGAPPNAVRKITLCIRDSPEIEFALDIDPESADARESYWPTPPTNKTLHIHLLAGQTIVARAVDEVHELSIIVEYLE